MFYYTLNVFSLTIPYQPLENLISPPYDQYYLKYYFYKLSRY